MARYDFKRVEREVQEKWDFRVSQADKVDYYVLEMFPYPSGSIHMGHIRNYAIGDVIARYKRACGLKVLHPIGWDAFGLPAENAALSYGVSPMRWTRDNINSMREQLKSIGISYNWEREISTCDKEYYKQEQGFFLDFLRHGLAYRKESWVNWDPVDNTVLANEQVIDGKGWRSGAQVEQRKLFQWFLKVTNFAEDLLQGLKGLQGWPEKVKLMQEHWIGKSEGVVIEFETSCGQSIEVFSTMPHMLFGASFCAISADHPILSNVKDPELLRRIDEFSKCHDRCLEKIGVDTGIVAMHPLLDRTLPVYVANFVLATYGTGAVFGCPAHDQRDFEFAVRYNLPIYQVVSPLDGSTCDTKVKPYTGDGVYYNSQFLDGITVAQAKNVMIEKLKSMNKCKCVTHYKLHDWGISRQRYWGCPIPVVHCPKCGVVPVNRSDLPVTLPEEVDFTQGGNPLDSHPTWKYVSCPACGTNAERETDTFDTFFESSWYFAAFCSPDAKIDKRLCELLLPVDCYIGGIEHAVLHLLYSRFFCRALAKCGHIGVKEPFRNLITQGMVCHTVYQDKEGRYLFPSDAKKMLDDGAEVLVGKVEKMSKSKKNVVDPSEMLERYGADTIRLFMLSDNPPERDIEWSDLGIEGSWRYIERLWRVLGSGSLNVNSGSSSRSAEDLKRLASVHKLLNCIGSDLEHYKLNCAVAKCREMTSIIFDMIHESAGQSVIIEAVRILLRVIEPFIPHIAEKLWEVIGGQGLLCDQSWPQVNQELLVEEMVVIAVQVNGKLCGTLKISTDADAEEVKKMAMDIAQHKIADRAVANVYFVPRRVVNIATIN